MKKRIQLALLAVLGTIAFVIDPASLWSYDFDDDDMRSVVEGRWSLTLRTTDGTPPRTFTLDIRQAGGASHTGTGWVRSAAACGSR